MWQVYQFVHITTWGEYMHITASDPRLPAHRKEMIRLKRLGQKTELLHF